MSAQLFNDKGEVIPARPNTNDESVCRKVVQLAIQMMFDSRYCPFDEDDRLILEDSTVNNFHLIHDEYELAKGFERDGWTVDRGFIDDLENLTSWIGDAERKIEKDWFDTYKPVMPLPIGSKVFLDGGCCVISGIYEYGQACYLVPTGGDGNECRIIKFEDVKPFDGEEKC
ncbi:MAG: hypothetical protein ACRC8W_02690 [Plesiomonas shigelloides]